MRRPRPEGVYARLAAADPHLARALATVGPPPPRQRPPGFASLLRIVLAQQLSTASAESLWRRLNASIDPLTPHTLSRRSPEGLRALGLSRQKARYALALASDVVAGRLDLDGVAALDDEAAIAAMTAVKGIGRWSAESYLLFALERPDVWPAGDLALAAAMQRLKGLERRPDPMRLKRLAEPWRPHRSAAARLLWHYYAAAR
ncbi:MAG: DNA-3-methyladenine glycosylase family protein [Pseudomonadota bacterium]